MPRPPISRLALLLALAAAPLPLAAQDTTAPAEGMTGDAAPADAAKADDLTLGVEVGGTPKVGDTYTAASFDSWDQRCVKTDLSADPCQLYQLLKDQDGNSVAEFSVFTLPEGSEGPAVAGATFIAPLETLLTEGLRIEVDGNKPRAYPFTFCAQIGCVARIGFTTEEVDMLKKGAKATAVIVPFVAPDQKVVLEVSLKGFTAGMDAVGAANKAADAAAAAKPADGGN